MRVFSGSSLFAVTLAVGVIAAPGGVLAQDGDSAPPSEPVVIEIIGDGASDTPEAAAESLPEGSGKAEEDAADFDLAPADSSMAATASVGGSAGGSGGGPGAVGSSEPREKVDPFVGSFSTAVPIQVPPFHGIEPNLALTYNSSRGNGFVGVGWQLSGLSTIERASPGEGAPGYDSNDIFLLDGRELIACVAGTVSPSCDTGGTHAGEIENYLRIKQDTVSNTWEVTGRDGTRTTYSAVMGPNAVLALDTYRWAMASVVDTHGNTVTYNWWCDGTPAVECYPETVTYNGNTVRFYREARPDPVTYATGAALARTDYRLKSVDVVIGIDRRGVLALEYQQSVDVGHSLLASASLHGTDAILDTVGLVTSGTSLPATTADYDNPVLGFANGPAVPVNSLYFALTSNQSSSYATADGGVRLADINGDGRADIVQSLYECNNWGSQNCETHSGTWLSTGDGFVPGPSLPSDFAIAMTGPNSYATADAGVRLGDINGDGKTDVLRALYECNDWYGAGCRSHTGTWLSTGDSFVPGPGLPSDFAIAMTGPNSYATADAGVRLGDINGDGKTDILRALYECNDWYGAGCRSHTGTWLSTGDSFVPGPGLPSDFAIAMTGPNSYATADAGVRLGDINGDGKTDILRALYECNDWYGAGCQTHGGTWLSTGDGFVPGPSLPSDFAIAMTGPNSYATADAGVRLGDINGDGKTDILRALYECNDWWGPGCQTHRGTWLSTGDGFVPGPTLPERVYFALTDLSGGYSTADAGARLADINGDGLIDIVEALWECNGWHDGTECQGRRNVWLGTGDDFVPGPALPDNFYFAQTDLSGGYSTADGGARIADIDGDGKADIIEALWECNGWHGPGCEGHRNVWLSTAGTNGLTSVTNPLGGTTTVDYTPSSAWTNQNLPMVLQTVSSITTDDGRGTPTSSSTTTYAYEGGLWHAAERRFLGFRKASTTLPCIGAEAQCPYTETTFRQDLASAGRVEQVDRFDGAGTLLTRALEEYVINDTTAPYTALNTASESQIIVGAVTRRTRVTRDFDAYANVILETALGDADVAGDEITAATDYNPNTADYIVSLPARLRSFDGIGTGGTLLTESRIIYDMYDPAVPFPPPAPTGNTSWNQPPTRGDANEIQDWLDTESRFISAQAGYDIYGNVTVTIDPLDRRSEIVYDTTYNLYPVAARNPLYFAPANDNRHQTSTTWNYVCGVPEVATDLNGNTTTTQYDALCRPTRTDLPDGGFTLTDYVSIGTPTAQYIQTETPPAGGTGNVWSRTYMDGFGRPYRSTARGPVAGQDITADTAYDARGNVASQTAPYYTGDPVHTTSFDYDALDRPTRTTHPDANWVETAYGVAGVFLSTTSHDELGHPVTLHLDAFGRSVRREEPLATSGGTVTVKTDYGYDDLGRLNAITDDVGNAWAYTHDSLGRTLTVDDPDLGLWTKTYDDAGQLFTQTDALIRPGETTGQVTRFTYDALGRMLTKTARHGAPDAEQTTYTYDESVAGFHNVGLLTRAENPTGILQYRYDEMGREAQRIYTIDGTARTLASGFDIAGRLIWQDYPDGDAVGSALDPITYDEAGRLYAIPGLVTHSAYDAAGNAEAMTFGNGVVSGYGFSDQRGWLDSVVTTSGAATIQNMTYGRDAAGQITSVASPLADESWTYAYDALRRLLSATNTDNAAHSRTYTYDTIGNMLSNSGVTGTYSYPAAGADRPHAVTSVGSWSYTYDANGNMTAGAGRSYTYDGENRPTQIDTQTYSYGPDGERWKTVDSAPGGGTTLYLGGSIEIAAGVMTKYLPGNAKRVGSPGDPLVETFWLHRDHQGSIQAITDAAGTQVQRFTYYPYGDRIATASAHEESKGWIGERQDATGLFYLHARYYDPVIGRFNTADPSDPARPGVGLNRYAYAGNNPVMRIDPWGMQFVGNDEADSGGTTKYTDRTSHGSMTRLEARWRSRTPSARARRNAAYQYAKQQSIDALEALKKTISNGNLERRTLLNAHMIGTVEQYRPETLEELQMQLELFGLAPIVGELADIINGIIFTARGDEVNAGLSFGSALPFAGWGAAGAKWARRLGLICSFAEGTPVLTPSGDVPIEMLEVGDLVLARNESTYEEDWREVTATFAQHHEFVLVLTTKGIDGSRSQITTTPNHPFHIQGRGWVPAGGLVVGDMISAANGAATVVVGVATIAEPQFAYNLEVEEFHTFFAGNNQEWVHNGFCGGVIEGTRGLQHSFDRHAAQWFGGEVSRTRHMAEWQALIERAAGSRRQVDWMTGNDPTVGHLARIGDKDFFVQFYTEGDRAGELATAFVPNRRELSRILRQLSGN